MNQTKQLDGLTSIRFFLALWVVFFHNNQEWATTGFFFEVIQRGYVAVSGFFMLSGFILAYNYNRKYELKAYFQNRFARIYPIYFFSLLLDLPLFTYFEYKTNPDYILTIVETSIASLFMIQSWNFSWLLHLNPPTWSLSVEAFLYAMFPMLMVLFQTKSKLFLMISSVVLYIICMAFFHFWFADIELKHDTKPVMHIFSFTAGIIAGLLFATKNLTILKFEKPLHANLMFVFIAFIFLLFLTTNFYDQDILSLGLLAPFYIAMFLLLAHNTKLLSSKILVRLGEISFSIYLLHWPLKSYLLIFYRFIGLNNYAVQFSLYLTLLILLSNYVYLYLELPLHKKLKYKFSQ